MRKLNLALQGGGSHGAYTWGVLDALLADGRIAFDGLSGTSAGALNAVALAAAWAHAEATGDDPREAARRGLERLWERVAAWDAFGAWQRQWSRLPWGGDWLPRLLHGTLSPYQSNPLGLNPLRDLLLDVVDFDALAHGPLKVWVAATHVATGRAELFTGDRLDVDAVLASACLPLLFRAVEIDGQAYWDGGYSANPALLPLVHDCTCRDTLLVQINPVDAGPAPRTNAAIVDRMSELTFNASLLAQLQVIEALQQALPPPERVRLHRIDAGEALQAWPASTRTSPDAAMIRKLRDLGRSAAQHWLAGHHDAIGVHGTLHPQGDAPAAPAPPAVRRLRPWLAHLLRLRR